VHLLLRILGVDDLSGPWYGFWSGFGSDLGELAIVGGLVAVARRHNCHVHHCWRVGRHPVEGTTFVVCRRHDPSGTVTADDVRRRYHLYTGSRPGKG
jgi:hypothetical protein